MHYIWLRSDCNHRFGPIEARPYLPHPRSLLRPLTHGGHRGYLQSIPCISNRSSQRYKACRCQSPCSAPLPLHSTSASTRPDPTDRISDFERLLERVRLRLFDNTVCLPVSRFGAHRLTLLYSSAQEVEFFWNRRPLLSTIPVLYFLVRTSALQHSNAIFSSNPTARTATCPQSHSFFNSSFFINQGYPHICCACFFVTVIFRQAHRLNRCKIAKFADLSTQIFILLIVQCISFINFHPFLISQTGCLQSSL